MASIIGIHFFFKISVAATGFHCRNDIHNLVTCVNPEKSSSLEFVGPLTCLSRLVLHVSYDLLLVG